MKFDFLRNDKIGDRNQVTFIGDKMEIFLPASIIGKPKENKTIAVELGNRVNAMGIYWFRVNEKDWYELQMPIKFDFQFSDYYKKRMVLRPGIPEQDYGVYVLKKGDAFVYDTLHRKDFDDLKLDYIQMMVEKGKLPNTVTYNDSLQEFINAMEVTQNDDGGVSSVNVEFILSEIYRCKSNMRLPYRMVFNGNQYGYREIPLTDAPQLNSTFTGLLGEDINNQLVAAVLRTREGLPEVESPVEKVIKY